MSEINSFCTIRKENKRTNKYAVDKKKNVKQITWNRENESHKLFQSTSKRQELIYTEYQRETVTGEWIREYSSMSKLDHSWVMFPEFQDWLVLLHHHPSLFQR